MTDIDSVFDMGYGEYLFRMEMYEKRQKKFLEEKAFEAWLVSRESKASNKKGEYVYKTFEDFKKILKTNVNSSATKDFSNLRKLAIFQRDFNHGGG